MVAVRKGMDVEPSRRDENVANECRSFSIVNIFPDKDAASAQPIVDFILWLRRTRDISHSYEANVLRGLTKVSNCKLGVMIFLLIWHPSNRLL